jgi:MFS family permease
MQQNKIKTFFTQGVSKNVYSLSFNSFLTDISREMIYPLLPLFLNVVLGAGTAFVGLVEGVAESTSSVLNLVSGWLSDKIRNRKTLMLWGYGLSAVTRPLVAIATAGWHVLVVRFVEKVGKGIRVPPRDALIAESCSIEHRGKAFGIHRALDNTGSILGPLFAFYLLILLNNDYRSLFWIASIPAFLAIGILTLLVSEEPKAPSLAEKATVELHFNLKQFNKNFKLFLVATLIFELANSSNAFLLLRVKDMGLSLELIPIIYLFSNISKTLGSLPGGVLSDRFGRRSLLVIGWVGYGLTYFGFAFGGSVNLAWFLFGIYGLFCGITEAVKKAFVADLVLDELRGSAYGIHSFISKLSELPASLILGIVWQAHSAALAFSIGAILSIGAGWFLFLFVPETSTRER